LAIQELKEIGNVIIKLSKKYFFFNFKALYRQFVTHSPNFIGWLRRRQTDIERQIRLEHMESICNSNFSSQILAERSQVCF